MATWAEAKKLFDGGLLPLPIKPTGEKIPAVKWKKYRDEKYAPYWQIVSGWFIGAAVGLSVLCGRSSGGLEQLDFDNHQTHGDEFEQWCKAIPADLLARLPIYQTPANGFRVSWRYWHCSEKAKTVLAWRGPEEASIELLSGCVSLCPGGSPRGHPTGKPYTYVRGHLAETPKITEEERALILEAAEQLSRWRPKPEPVNSPSICSGKGDWHAWDDYDHRATWEEVLEPHGWEISHTHGDVTYWRRPGKGEGVSATTNYAEADLLHVFTSSTAFRPDKSYSKSAAFAILNHDGDFSAAAQELARLGYGRANQIHDLEEKVKAFYERKSTIIF